MAGNTINSCLFYRLNTQSVNALPVICCSLIFLFASAMFAQDADSLGLSHQTNHNGLIEMLEIHADDPRYQEGAFDMGEYLYILPDSSNTWKIEDISSPAFSDRFISDKAEVLNRANPDVAWFWVRFTLHSQLDRDEEWLTNLAFPEVRLFEQLHDGTFSEKRTGTYVPYSQRYFGNRYGSLSILPVFISADSSKTVYLKLKAAEPFADHNWGLFHGKMVSPDYVYENGLKHNISRSIALGIVITVACYHLIFFFFNQLKTYLYFGLFVLFHSFVSAFFSDFILEYVLSEYPGINNDFLFQIAVPGFISFLALFSGAYLKLQQYIPRWRLLLSAILFVQIGFCIGMTLMRVSNPSYYESYSMIYIKSYTFFIGVIMLLFLLLALYLLKKEFRPALTYSIAVGLSIAQQILNVFAASGAINLPSILRGETGSLIGMLIFAISLGRRFKDMQAEKIKAESLQKEEQAESRRLKELDEFKSRFYTNITHEFRTPLTVIQGLADQIKENPRWKVQEQLDLIKNNSQKLLSLINQLLNLSRLEAGKLEPEYLQADIVKYLNYLTESFHSLALSRTITLSFFSTEDELVMDFDPEKLQQVISNLLSNALKFTPEYGKITLSAQQVRKNEPQKLLEIKVRDTGVGIEKENLPFIFDRFYQVDNSSIRKGEGTGLGLALVRELMELMEGNIAVESESGKGTTFTLLLPIRNEAPLKEIKRSLQEQINSQERPIPENNRALEASTSADKAVVLIVEDNLDVIYYLRSCLEDQYQILEAQNGREGIDIALREIPELVITDVMMPEVDGFELCKSLKTDERTNHIPIVMLTAKATQADKLEGLTQGADAYLAKPFQKEELRVRLENLLELRNQLQEKYQTFQNSPEEEEDPFLQKIRQLILDHLDDADFGVLPLSRALGMSRVQVHRKLKAMTDLSTTQFIRQIRMQQAYQLLKNAELSVSEVGYMVGFKDPGHFSRVFSQHFGVAPSETRK